MVLTWLETLDTTLGERRAGFGVEELGPNIFLGPCWEAACEQFIVQHLRFLSSSIAPSYWQIITLFHIFINFLILPPKLPQLIIDTVSLQIWLKLAKSSPGSCYAPL